MRDVQSDLSLLVTSAQLVHIGFHEISAKRAAIVLPTEGKVTVAPTWSIEVQGSERQFRVVIGTSISTPVGAITTTSFAEYTVSDEAPELTERLLAEYVNEVAVMQLMPFIRQAVADVTQRVFGSPLLLPIQQRGQLRFEVANRDEG